jgi:2-dehydro-3-deoxy-L-rhamnonate dehydrogenase (NAD+)
VTDFPAGYTVMVAGGASGIGRATALHLCARGVTVHAYDQDAGGLATLRQDCAPIHTHPLDVTDDDAVVHAIESLKGNGSQLHSLINTVGINPDAGTPSHEVDMQTFDHVYRVNLRAAMILTKAVLPGMLKAGYGRIVHVASIAGKEGNPRMASYSATKAGLIGLTKAIGREYATTGVTINAIAPAVIRTPLVDATAPDVVKGMLARIPMGRAGELEEIATMLAFMISPGCSFTTGFTFDLSGGRATY